MCAAKQRVGTVVQRASPLTCVLHLPCTLSLTARSARHARLSEGLALGEGFPGAGRLREGGGRALGEAQETEIEPRYSRGGGEVGSIELRGRIEIWARFGSTSSLLVCGTFDDD